MKFNPAEYIPKKQCEKKARPPKRAHGKLAHSVEVEVLDLKADGIPTAEVASTLGISKSTIERILERSWSPEKMRKAIQAMGGQASSIAMHGYDIIERRIENGELEVMPLPGAALIVDLARRAAVEISSKPSPVVLPDWDSLNIPMDINATDSARTDTHSNEM